MHQTQWDSSAWPQWARQIFRLVVLVTGVGSVGERDTPLKQAQSTLKKGVGLEAEE